MKKAVIVGVGAVGCRVASILAKKGLSLKLIDRDFVDESNLARQKLYSKKDLGRPKAVVAAKKLGVMGVVADLDRKNIRYLDADIILDCTDNFEARYLINDYCKKRRIPWIYAAAIGNIGTSFVITPDGPCFNCIFSSHHGTETCDTAGVSSGVLRKVSSFQARQALRILSGKKPEKSMVRFAAGPMKLGVSKRSNCSSCNGVYDYLSGRKGSKMVKLCGSSSYQIKGRPVSLKQLMQRLKKGNIPAKAFPHCIYMKDLTLFKDGRAIVKASSLMKARSIYSRIVG